MAGLHTTKIKRHSPSFMHHNTMFCNYKEIFADPNYSQPQG